MQQSNTVKVALCMFYAQISWTASYLFVLLLIFLVKTIGSSIGFMDLPFFNDQANLDSLSTIILFSCNIFMFVIGIVAAYGFLHYFVSNGITRKQYFNGAVISSFAIALTIPVIIKIVFMMEKIVPISFKEGSKIIEADADMIEQIVLNLVYSPFIDLQESWLLGIVLFAFNIFVYYLAGWLIGISFHRFGVVMGLLSIPITVGVLLLYDGLMALLFDTKALNIFPIPSIPHVIAYVAAFAIILGMLFFIRQSTKNIVVKL